ncbi:MAG: hypothetical protein NTW56_02185 [Alphaproteobacteria bacterium]|nr:hypothetical protein [Alphaproteobacteria bacterium]
MQPTMTEQAWRAVVARVEREKGLALVVPADEWPTWWRAASAGLDAAAAQAIDPTPPAAALVERVLDLSRALTDALAQRPVELGGADTLDHLAGTAAGLPGRHPRVIAAAADAWRLSLPVLADAARAALAEMDRVAHATTGQPAPRGTGRPLAALQIALRALADAYDGAFRLAGTDDPSPLQPTATSDAKPGRFATFAEVALEGFAECWRSAPWRAPCPFEGADLTSGAGRAALRRAVEARAETFGGFSHSATLESAGQGVADEEPGAFRAEG